MTTADKPGGISGDEGVFQHYPLDARPILTAVLERMNEALEACEPLPRKLTEAFVDWNIVSLKATLSGFDLVFDSFYPEAPITVSWFETIEDFNGNVVGCFDRDDWPYPLRDWITHEEVGAFNAHLSRRLRAIEGAFLDAALAGKEAIYARIGSPVERGVTRIPPDVWANFSVVDWKTGGAVVPETPHVIYGACAVAVAPGLETGSKGHDQALALLTRENESRVSGGMPPLTIQETVEWAAREGLTREVARALRDQLPNHLKLSVGQKKRDLKARPD